MIMELELDEGWLPANRWLPIASLSKFRRQQTKQRHFAQAGTNHKKENIKILISVVVKKSSWVS